MLVLLWEYVIWSTSTVGCSNKTAISLACSISYITIAALSLPKLELAYTYLLSNVNKNGCKLSLKDVVRTFVNAECESFLYKNCWFTPSDCMAIRNTPLWSQIHCSTAPGFFWINSILPLTQFNLYTSNKDLLSLFIPISISFSLPFCSSIKIAFTALNGVNSLVNLEPNSTQKKWKFSSPLRSLV